MIVTELVEVTKKRSKVYIDHEFAFVLYKGELRTYGIFVGKEIKEECYAEIMDEVLPKRAKLRAMNLLMQRSYTQTQLTSKLKDGFYPEEVVEEAIEYVKSFHYIDDVQYAVDYLTYHEGNKSLKKMEQDLMGKGIGREIFDKAVSIWEELGGKCNEQEMIKSLLVKKKYHEDMDFKEKQKIIVFLLRKGFSMDVINKSMKNDAFI
ncbi:MAG: regulatory protein RecX [Lachnospiraceae bacterium]|nr:regulatory protein RecX [Lachnospiraceae bacterium]